MEGVSALQLQRNLGLHSCRSAWHLAHRIRKAMAEKTTGLKGIVEQLNKMIELIYSQIKKLA